MKCLKCGWSNNDTAAYCQHCHAYLAEPPGMETLDAFKALALGLFVTGIFYLVFPVPFLRSEYWLHLFSGRISETIFTLVVWSLFLVWFKYRHYRLQRQAYSAFRNQSLHDSLANGIYVKDVDQRILEISQFLQEQKVNKFQDSIIFRRVRRTLRHLKAIPKKEEITSILNYQAEIDYNRMQSSYSLLNVFIWAIPILGFIGTVFGIGQSIGEFSEFIRGANGTDLTSQMRSALSGVTSGLSIAFGTTFLALVGVIPIMILASSLRKREEDLLLSVEEYCLEDLLPNLHLRPGDETGGLANEHLEQLVDFSDQWRKQIVPILSSLENNAKSLGSQISGLQPMVKDFSENLMETEHKISTHNENVNVPVKTETQENVERGETETEITNQNPDNLEPSPNSSDHGSK